MKIRNLTKSYEDKVVLRDFSAKFPRGRHIAIMGPSGCGKTTLLRLILGLERPDSGEILRRGRCVAVFQEDRLSPPLSAVSNLRLVRPSLSREEARALLSRLGLEKDTDRPVSTLSGGMSRRVAIARALVADADTVLLDEPFSALDAATKGEVMAVMKEALAHKTVLLVTHDIEEAKAFSDEIFFFPAVT